MILRLKKSHVFTFESENVQSEDKAQLKPDAGGLERSSPFPFKLKEDFRNLWKQLAVRFDGRHCGMRILSIRRLPPFSSKLLWRFGLSSVADFPAVSWWPPGIQALFWSVWLPTCRQNKQSCGWTLCVGRLGGFWGFRKSFLVRLAGEQRVQQEQTNTCAYFMATNGMFLPSAKYFSPYQRLSFFLLKIHQGSLEASVTSRFMQDLGGEWSYCSIWTLFLALRLFVFVR